MFKLLIITRHKESVSSVTTEFPSLDSAEKAIQNIDMHQSNHIVVEVVRLYNQSGS